ncbi:MAG TPA: hypothetical protein VE053_12245 [Allosphingosinicella sp.]|nr:hypothetical protein [Allosphingosinicella sp.]
MATTFDKGRVPGWYWAVAAIAFLWAAMGCYAYLTQVSMDSAALAQLPAEQREIWAAMPGWAVGAYAVAVWAGLLGALGLLLRRTWARLAYAASLLAVIVQFGWTFLATSILTTMGPSAAAFPAFILVVAALLLWFSGIASKRGWLR